MQTKSIYSSKAEKYARYRWDYAPEAIATILTTTGLAPDAVIADIGAGTGILTKHFLDYARHVYAVELNPEMRQIAEQTLGTHPAFHNLDASAEATTLSDQSVDLITVAQAIHWFEPTATKREFSRILKPGGWLAILRNYGVDLELDNALKPAMSKDFGVRFASAVIQPGKDTPVSFYYGGDHVPKQLFPFTNRQTWEEFLGSNLSASYTPDEDHPQYPRFEQALHDIFTRFSVNGSIATRGVTELYLGHIV